MVTTRRNAASSIDPAQSASEHASQRETSPVEPPKKRARRARAPAAQPESQSHTETSARSRTSGVVSTMVTTATVTTGSVTVPVPKRTTRAARAAGVASPLRAPSESQPKRQSERHKQKRTAEHAEYPPEPAPAAPAQDEGDSDNGMFFSKREHIHSSPSPQTTQLASSNLEDADLGHNNALLDALVQKLEEQLADSQADLLESQADLAESQADLDESERLRAQDQADLAEYEKRLLESEQLRADVQARCAEYESRLAESEEQRLALEQRLVRARFESDQKAATSVHTWVGLGRQLNRQKTKIVKLETDCSSLRLHYESPLQDLQALNSSINSLMSSTSSTPQTPSRQCSRDSAPSDYLPLHHAQQSPPSFRTRVSNSDQYNSDRNSANLQSTDFDSDMLGMDDEPTPEPTIISGSKSAIALLEKIEKNAKRRHDNSECGSDDGESPRVRSPRSPRSSRPSVSSEQPFTPMRVIASPSGFFSKSLSILKAKFGFSASTPLPPPCPEPTLKPIEPLTELLSMPPTPEPSSTPARRRNANPLLRTLLRGVAPADLAKARHWAKPVVQQLKADSAFRDKRTRLETPVLAKDLEFYPSSKPWENGFGDPLSEFDDDDIIPVWAVYMSMVAEEDKDRHRTKRTKSDRLSIGGPEMAAGSLNEQYAAYQAAAATASADNAAGLHNSHGHSASLHDLQPRRSTDPSPMFDTPVLHQEGDNVFREQKGYDTTAQIRENDRDILQQQTKQTVGTHNPTMGSFTVPDGSDEEDATMDESADGTGAPLWTQPPPPAPVPAHAPLPGGPPTDAPSVPAVQQPVDEVERQRQKLMKHTPAKPSRLREAIYPSPSILSEAGNEAALAGSPIPMGSLASISGDIPKTLSFDIDEEYLQVADVFAAASSGMKAAPSDWQTAVMIYDSEEEVVSPV